MINADGTNPFPVATTTSSEGGPTWSPDGLKIAFRSTEGGIPQIWIVTTDGTGAAAVTIPNTVGGEAPAWSMQGARLAFTSKVGDESHIFTINVNGTDRVPVTVVGGTFEPSWSN